MDVKLLARALLTAAAAAAFAFAGHALEYWGNLAAVDNLAGAAPLVLLSGVTGFLIALIWKRHKGSETSTVALAALAVVWALLFVPSITGDWHPLAKKTAPDLTMPDLTAYEPFSANTKAAKLPAASSLALTRDFPVLDGATALYPVYASFVNAVYPPSGYEPGLALCTNTQNAYKRIIEGGCDIIFVAGASGKQKQAASAAGANLVFMPVGREAFVFLVGKGNPVDGLSHRQLINIYSGKTAHWRTLGWGGGKIIVFQRPEGSGSQTGLQNIMRGHVLQKPQPLPDASLIGSGSMMRQVSVQWRGVQPALGYSYRYYATTMYPNESAKILAVDGVYPSNETIADGSYAFSSDFYAVTNGEPEGNAKRLIDWVLSDEGQLLVAKTGYAPCRR